MNSIVDSSLGGSLALLVVGTALSLPLLPAQQGSGGLRRVPSQADERTEVDPWQADAWRRDLAVSDLEERERNFERLVQAARRDSEGRARLEEWSRDSDTEFAWSARLALRELDHRGLFPGQDFFKGFQLETPDRFGPLHAFTFPHTFDFDLFDGMQGQTGSLESEKSSISLSITPDGVQATVTTEEDGIETKQEYSAESLDALLEAHPELRDRIGGVHVGGLRGFKGLQLFTPGTPFQLDLGPGMPGGLGGGLQLGPGLFGRPHVGQPRTDVLGVYVQPTSEAQAQVDATLPQTGLYIQKVEPGTIAAELGLEAGQTLQQIDGREVHSRDDISAAMRERSKDAAIEVDVIEPDGTSRTLRWEPKRDAPSPGQGQSLRRI
jgi:hypothetical protein